MTVLREDPDRSLSSLDDKKIVMFAGPKIFAYQILLSATSTTNLLFMQNHQRLAAPDLKCPINTHIYK